MTRKQKGTQSVGAIMCRIIAIGKVVLLPVGDNERYDFVIDDQNRFLRVQCKHGRLKDGAVRFATSSTNLAKGKWVRNTYEGQVDLFGVHCTDNGKVYLVPFADVAGIGHEAALRLEPAKNGQSKGIRLAGHYEVRA